MSYLSIIHYEGPSHTVFGAKRVATSDLDDTYTSQMFYFRTKPLMKK